MPQRRLDPLADAARLTLVEGGQQTLQERLRRAERRRRGGAERRTVTVGEMQRTERPDLGHDDALVPLELGVGTVAAKSGDRAVDEATVIALSWS